jgi:diguanylate cyclase (GGDEF)-like protein
VARKPAGVRSRPQGGKPKDRAPRVAPQFRDPATGFYTLPLFREILFVEVKRARRYGLPLALALLQFDPPAVSGPKRGQLLAGLARVVRDSLRDTDLPVQFSQEQVLLVMTHTELAGALTVCERIRERVEKASFTISVGVCASPMPGKALSVADLVQNAQKCLSAARGQGGNRVEFFDRADVAHALGHDEATG